MEQGIKYVITGDTKGLDNATKQAERSIDDLSKRISDLRKSILDNNSSVSTYRASLKNLHTQLKTGNISQKQYAVESNKISKVINEIRNSTNNYRKELIDLRQAQQTVSNSSESISSGFQKISRRGGGATAAVTAFGGVIQDAPYGIRGVANNIEFLTNSFINLQRSSGGTVPAIKAFLSSLAGPAGIIIAVSAVTSGLTALSQSGVRLSDILSFLTGESNDLAKAQRDLAEASRDAVGEAAAEVATIKALVGVLQDENSTREESLRAYQKINDLQPSVLDGLTLEDAKTQDLTKNIDLLTASLIREAKIRGAQELISKETAKILEAESKNVIDSANAWDLLVAGMSGMTAVSEATVRGARRQGEEIDDSRKKIEQFTQRLQELIGEDIALEGFFTDVGKNAREGIEKAIKLKPLDLSGLKFSGMDKLAEQAAYIFSTQFGEKVSTSDLTGDIEITGELLTNTNQLPTEGIDEYIGKLQKAQEVSKVFGDAAGNSFMAFGQKLANSLETGNSVLDAFVGSLINSLSQMLAALAESAIQQIAINKATATSSAIAGGAASGAATGPGAIFSTPAFIATLVGLVSAAFAGIATSFAQGGLIGGGSFTGDKVPILANSGEYVLTAQDQGYLTNFLRGNTGGTTNTGGELIVTGRIEAEGSKLVTVISNTQRRSNRLGGSMKL